MLPRYRRQCALKSTSLGSNSIVGGLSPCATLRDALYTSWLLHTSCCNHLIVCTAACLHLKRLSVAHRHTTQCSCWLVVSAWPCGGLAGAMDCQCHSSAACLHTSYRIDRIAQLYSIQYYSTRSTTAQLAVTALQLWQTLPHIPYDQNRPHTSAGTERYMQLAVKLQALAQQQPAGSPC